ncbi:MAG TPA: endonuclease III domain-containing protein [Syntrophorhabdaceae bacterium]|nr:endonuclease III domain-containing protein [Syntrophorhabdaceae bacterium]
MKTRLLSIFNALLEAFGPRHWWPGETRLEVIVGAVLTQNTSWKNVEKAIANLKSADAMDLRTLHEMQREKLAELIKPSGFYNVKSIRLKNTIDVIYNNHSADLRRLESMETELLRDALLSINGIGKETADSIALYAFNKPIFVIDAYTRRFVRNHGLYSGADNYDSVQLFFMQNLPSDTYLFNEFHALIVRLCQNYCRKTPLCEKCPLKEDTR